MSTIDIDALREEALAGPEGDAFRQGIPVKLRGIEFRVPPQRLWPLTVVRAARRGEIDVALARLVGDEVAEQLIDAGMVLDDFERLGTLTSGPAQGAAGPPTRRSSAPGG